MRLDPVVNRRAVLRAASLGVLAPLIDQAEAGDGFANGPVHDGTEIGADLDNQLRLRNVGGTDGAGLCVWASLTMAARYHNCRELFNLFEAMKRERGGGWPSRVDEKMKLHAPHVRYEQWVGNDLSFIQAQIRKGRMVCATYGYGEFYKMRTIAHMVCVVGMNARWTAILDNNDPTNIWWMPTAEFLRRFIHPTGQGWAVAIHLPPPPPTPHN